METKVENKVTKKVRMPKREKGNNPEKWSDGEARIHDEMRYLIYNLHRFNLNGKQIKATYNPITTPRAKEKLIIDGILYSVKSVMLEIKTDYHDKYVDGVEYHIELIKCK